ncbi:hypothetical protein V1280_003486 [Bradyrhizobium sp. AZCC 2230]
METDVGDEGNGDLVRVRSLDGYGVEIGRVVQDALIVMITWRPSQLRVFGKCDLG